MFSLHLTQFAIELQDWGRAKRGPLWFRKSQSILVSGIFLFHEGKQKVIMRVKPGAFICWKVTVPQGEGTA